MKHVTEDMCADSTLMDMISRQALAAPEDLAICHSGAALTYGQLEARANRLAAHLRSIGAGLDTPVALCLDRSPEMVIAALAIMKAGAAYVPLDPAYPTERLEFMLHDSQAAVMLTRPGLSERLRAAPPVKVVDCSAPEGDVCSPEPAQHAPNPDNLAYIIYTSGSTGKPKGVEITHRGLLNLVEWHIREFHVASRDRATQLANLSFDATVWELWPYLAAGASVHLVPDCVLREPDLLRSWIVEQAITISFAPTPMAERLMRMGWPQETRLRLLLTGGDTLHRFPDDKLPFTVVNNYGPTECTVVATSGRLRAPLETDSLPPIGRPIADTRVYILDEEMNEVAPGVPGEMYIAGPGVARCYRNQPTLTAERFVSNSFNGNPAQRLFKTGDRARLLPDGQIAFLGRLDDQIKVRGYRIEPNEIAAALNCHPSVVASAVTSREDSSGDRQLVAYLVPDCGQILTYSEIAGFLGTTLPQYMIPAIMVKVDALPTTHNGKVDRAALPEPDAGNMLRDDDYTGPRTAIEAMVMKTVAGLLGVNEVGVHDNFFLLGGNSLMGAQLVADLEKILGMAVPLRVVFSETTVAGLSAAIERMSASGGNGQPCAHSMPNAGLGVRR